MMNWGKCASVIVLLCSVPLFLFAKITRNTPKWPIISFVDFFGLEHRDQPKSHKNHILDDSGNQRRQLLQEAMPAPIRIFGPAVDETTKTNDNNTNDISILWYTTGQQRQFVQQNGRECWPALAADDKDNNVLLDRFDALGLTAPFLQLEVWKFCVFYTGQGNVFWDPSQVTPLVRWQDVWSSDAKSTALLVNPQLLHTNSNKHKNDNRGKLKSSAQPWIHPSFLRLDPAYAAPLSRTVLRLLLETEDILLISNPLYTYQAIAQQILNDSPNSVRLWKAQCQVPSPQNPVDQVLVQRLHSKHFEPLPTINKNYKRQSRKLMKYQHHNNNNHVEPPPEFSQLPMFGLHCTIPGGYCCQVWNEDEHNSDGDGEQQQDQNENQLMEMPFLMVKHPFGTSGEMAPKTKSTTLATLTKIEYPLHKPVPYWSTVTAVPTTTKASTNYPVSKLESPNFFDILLQNNCLPTSPECHSCLKRYTSTTGCDEQCTQECPCYCKVLCQIRPPPKQVQAVWYVSPPLHQLPETRPPRLIPRVIHQTWYEPLTPDKYPNMSRLQQSWKQSGWTHKFYDDAAAAKFLQEHFPPPVLEAYHAIQPGAFKADLFRYCCLLIQGGVYADMDVLLETNLEEAIAPNVGFMTPMDEPGIKVGQQACLWNGFMAVAPGHPFVAKTIELVVNNIRNRFTSVDYDDMLCPNPILSASHLWDILFTTGPCILGTAMNMVLQRHPQTGFTTGEIDIWGGGGTADNLDLGGKRALSQHRQQHQQHSSSSSKTTPKIEPDDPRLAIPGRSIILRQNKNDMGAHRFTLEERNLVVCSTDMPNYDDRPKKPHYAESGRQTSLYGTTQLYSDFVSANEEIRVIVVGNPNNYTL